MKENIIQLLQFLDGENCEAIEEHPKQTIVILNAVNLYNIVGNRHERSISVLDDASARNARDLKHILH